MPKVKLETRGWIAQETLGDMPVRPAEVTISGPMPQHGDQCVLSVRIGEESQVRACVLVPKALMDFLAGVAELQAAGVKKATVTMAGDVPEPAARS